MPTLSERDHRPQARAVEIVAEALRVLRTRDGLEISDDLILERARNAVTALEADFELVPVGPVAALVMSDFVAAVDTVSDALRPEVA